MGSAIYPEQSQLLRNPLDRDGSMQLQSDLLLYTTSSGVETKRLATSATWFEECDAAAFGDLRQGRPKSSR